MVLLRCSCRTPSRHMDFSISVMNISRQHCSWMKSRQTSGWISPSSRLRRRRRRRREEEEEQEKEEEEEEEEGEEEEEEARETIRQTEK